MKDKPKIDLALRAWADRQAPNQASLRALEARIAQQCRQPAGNPIAWPPVVTRLHGWFCFAAGVAATLLIVGSWAVFSRDHNRLQPLLREEGGLFAGRKPAMSRVFCETERLFGSNLQWLAQSGHSAELGLVDEPAGRGKAMIVHLSVVARRVGDGKVWRRVWQADVVARADGIVELAPDGIPGNHIALWLHRLDDGKAFVESRLELANPVKLDAETREILTFGTSRDVTRIRSGDTEYLLLQTISPTGGEPCSS